MGAARWVHGASRRWCRILTSVLLAPERIRPATGTSTPAALDVAIWPNAHRDEGRSRKPTDGSTQPDYH
jgi:hypothetical protein